MKEMDYLHHLGVDRQIKYGMGLFVWEQEPEEGSLQKVC
jgi:hypothetical protein